MSSSRNRPPAALTSCRAAPLLLSLTPPPAAPVTGERFWYQQLMLKSPFRDSSPSSFISDTNESGTLREECRLRGILPRDLVVRGGGGNVIRQSGISQLIRDDAEARLFTQESIDGMLERLAQHEARLTCTLHAEAQLQSHSSYTYSAACARTGESGRTRRRDAGEPGAG